MQTFKAPELGLAPSNMATASDSRGDSAPQEALKSHPYTCNTCQVAFRNSDLQKGHMRNDWHQYNLLRRVASLPPITSEAFTERVLLARAKTKAEAGRAGWAKGCQVCKRTFGSENSYLNHIASQKHKEREAVIRQRTKQSGAPVHAEDASSVMSSTFSLGEPMPANKSQSEMDSDAAEEFSHIVEGMKSIGMSDRPSPVKRPSNPHLSEMGQHSQNHPVSDVSSEEQSSSVTPTPSKRSAHVPPSLTIKNCLFCNYESPSVHLSATHMERIHGMFIPEKQYLVDLDGLLGALQNRVQDLHECLCCGKVKATAYAVQTHMRDKSHCQIPYTTVEEQLEIGEFYDFRSTYSDEEEDSDDESVQNGGARLGGKRTTTTTNEDGDEVADGEDDGWETDSSASSLNSADLTAVPMDQHYHQYERLDKHPHHSHHGSKLHHQRDGLWHSHSHSHKPTHAAYYDDCELHLPSGKSVGHRSLNRYYRQNLHNYPTPQERAYRQQRAIESGLVDWSHGRLVSRSRNRDETCAWGTRANGGLGMRGVSERKKREAKRAELRGRFFDQTRDKRNEWGISKNSNFQKSFRLQFI